MAYIDKDIVSWHVRIFFVNANSNAKGKAYSEEVFHTEELAQEHYDEEVHYYKNFPQDVLKVVMFKQVTTRMEASYF